MRNKFILTLIAFVIGSLSVLNAQTTLAEATKGKFLFGVALGVQLIDGSKPAEATTIAKEFNAIVPGNCMKSALIHPEENRFFWDDADKFVAFGEKNKLVVTGHCLIWHSQLSKWFCIDKDGKDVAPEILKERMRQHIYAVVGRYKGRIKGWDVVNEAFNDNGTYRNSKFFQILGKDFIKYAFQFAHEADPNVELYYNDYNVETPAKCDAIIQLVKELKVSGLRIDAVGSQSHMHLIKPTLLAIENSLIKLKTAGIKVCITEWDISILPSPYDGANVSTNFEYTKEMDPYRNGVPDDIQQKWNKRMIDVFSLFLKYSDNIDRVTLWGLNDAGTWLNNFPIKGRMDYPLLFDRENKPKSVVAEMIKLAVNTKNTKSK